MEVDGARFRDLPAATSQAARASCQRNVSRVRILSNSPTPPGGGPPWREKLAMNADEAHPVSAEPAKPVIRLDRHSSRYRLEFEEFADEFTTKCPVAWNDTHR